MITYDWLFRRVDVDAHVFGPQQELLLTAQQRRELVRLLAQDLLHGGIFRNPVSWPVKFQGLPVRVPRRDAYMGGVRA